MMIRALLIAGLVISALAGGGRCAELPARHYTGSKMITPLADPAQPEPPATHGKVLKITKAMTLKQLLAKPDGDVLEAPNGKRITVGELRAAALRDEQAKKIMLPGKVIRAIDSKRLEMLRVLKAQKQVGETEHAHPAQMQRMLDETAPGPHAQTSRSQFQLRAKANPITLPGSGQQYHAPTMAAPLLHDPEISTVNGRTTGATFTPEREGNYFTIRGYGFGDQPGTAALIGKFNAGKIPLEVLDWQNLMITVRMNPSLGGEPDMGGITLIVTPQSGSPLRKGGFNFYAAREVVLLPQIPQSFFASAEHIPVYSTPGTSGHSVQVNRTHDTYDTWWVGKTPEQIEAGLGDEGTDHFHFEALSPGFTTYDAEMWHGPMSQYDIHSICDTCSCNVFEFSGTYGIAWNGDNLDVNWGLWTCEGHTQDVRVWFDYYQVSQYWLNIRVIGPRGLNPLPV